MTDAEIQLLTIRILFGFVFLVVIGIMAWRIWRGGTAIEALLKLGQEDKIARELAVKELQTAAEELKNRTDVIEEERKKQLAALDAKVEANTELTKAAATTSAEALKRLEEKQ